MTARLSPLQRQVLEQLAHIRVAPEDAWLTTERLAQLTMGNDRENALHKTAGRLVRLDSRGFVRVDLDVGAWRITDKGREALQ